MPAELVAEELTFGATAVSLLRPREPEELLDEEAFENDEFIPYWAELWPAGLALSRSLPERLDGLRVVDLGCGLGVPALVAATRGADVTAVDWAADAIALLADNADRNGLVLDLVQADWRSFTGAFDLVLAADLLYEQRNADALLDVLPRLAPEVLLAEPGRPHAAGFFDRARADWRIDEIAERVHRLTPATRRDSPARPGA
ncbi:MAG TPA: methyltransferase domain-containing protein [Gaiellaceae bacterium]|jgi:predicted nicotinamide N-methyase|nr:methyltransferase domain-containing protein [Gaiellaceae bacterium]